MIVEVGTNVSNPSLGFKFNFLLIQLKGGGGGGGVGVEEQGLMKISLLC